MGEPLTGLESAHKVSGFVEKPSADTARAYVESGRYLWNSGIFLASAKTLIAELSMHEPDILVHCHEAIFKASRSERCIELEAQSFCSCPSTSFDRAVMERTARAAVIPTDIDWADTGSWSAVSELAERDPTGNTLVGKVLTHLTCNSYVRSEGPIIAAVGVDGLIIVATADAVLVTRKNSDQDVRTVVARLRDSHPDIV
jgi:mannose-1-phosphate guanylyltransferase